MFLRAVSEMGIISLKFWISGGSPMKIMAAQLGRGSIRLLGWPRASGRD
jgi:hypothetical protein